jgi:integrase
MHGIFRRAQIVWEVPVNPLTRVEKHPMKSSGDIRVFSPDEVSALVRAAASEPDGALFLTAAFTGLRMGELLALRWRDVDFAGSTIRVRASYAGGVLTTPKSGKVRAVPLAPTSRARSCSSAAASIGWERTTRSSLARLVRIDGSALRRRYKEGLGRAALRPLRFHDLRHTFGTRMIAKADIRRVQEWIGHADIQTTMRYLHYAPHAEDAALVAEAFRVDSVPDKAAELS